MVRASLKSKAAAKYGDRSSRLVMWRLAELRDPADRLSGRACLDYSRLGQVNLAKCFAQLLNISMLSSPPPATDVQRGVSSCIFGGELGRSSMSVQVMAFERCLRILQTYM